MRKLALITVTAAVLLSGCKTEIEKNISLNNLLTKPLYTESAQLKIEVASCNDFRDSRKPSDSLITVQQKVPFLFPQAEFKECYRSQFNSYALFSIPVGVGVVDSTTQKSTIPEISLISIDGEQKAPLITIVHPNLKNRLAQLKKTEFLANNLDLSIILNIKNDYPHDKKVNIISSYLNDEPQPNGADLQFHANSGKTLKIKLSDVAIDSLMTKDELGFLVVIDDGFLKNN